MNGTRPLLVRRSPCGGGKADKSPPAGIVWEKRREGGNAQAGSGLSLETEETRGCTPRRK